MSDDKTVVAEQNTENTSTNQGNSRTAPVLLQYDGGAAGKRFSLTGKEVLIGRSASKVQVWIDDASVSREHCRIDLDNRRAIVTDLGSLNHTYINDQIVLQSAELCHGDMLRVGNVRLRYFAHGSADQLLFDRIYRMAVTDRMLEIFRRDYILEKLDEELRLTKLANANNLSLIMFDLDKFKSVNDTYGHDAGDFVLKEVCKIIKPLLRPKDVFGRYGGEEFCILMADTEINTAHSWAENMRLKVAETIFDYEGIVIPVTISAGVTSVSTAINSSQDFIKAVDALVYQSKSGGRNRVSKA